MGRKGKYEEWLNPDGLLRIEGWARDGLTEAQIAHNMGISVSSLADWKNKYPQLLDALKKGKAPVDIEVENALLKSALGHTQIIRKPIKVKTERQIVGEGRYVEEHIEYAEEEVYTPPQVLAQIFWLKNRKPDKWREKQVIEADTSALEKLDAILAQNIKNAGKQDDLEYLREEDVFAESE
jgi:hypothetical protein